MVPPPLPVAEDADSENIESAGLAPADLASYSCAIAGTFLRYDHGLPSSPEIVCAQPHVSGYAASEFMIEMAAGLDTRHVVETVDELGFAQTTVEVGDVFTVREGGAFEIGDAFQLRASLWRVLQSDPANGLAAERTTSADVGDPVYRFGGARGDTPASAAEQLFDALTAGQEESGDRVAGAFGEVDAAWTRRSTQNGRLTCTETQADAVTGLGNAIECKISVSIRSVSP